MGKSTDLRFVTLNKYIREPVKEYQHKGWVLNGKNNSHYQYIIDRYYGSTTNGTAINSIIDLVYGKGITVKGLDQESQEVANFHQLISKKDLKAIITDAVIFNELSCQVIRKNKGTLSQLKHIDKYKVVPSIEDIEGNITSYWFSRDWANQWKMVNGRRIAEPVQYPAFPLGEKGETELFVAKPYRVGKEYFPDPVYLPVLPYAEFEEEVANYYLKYIKNGLSLGNIINVPNSFDWSDPQKDDYEKKVKAKLTGSENANSVIISFNGDNDPTTIESIKNEYAHKQWDFLTVEARQQILTGHRITSPSLVGVISSSGFSSTADEMDMAEHQFMKRVISPIQNFVIDSLREVLDYFGQDMDLMFVPLTEKEENKEGNVIEKEKNEVEEEVELSAVCNCDKKKSELDKFIDLGEDEDLESYDLIDEIEVDYNEEVSFTSTGTARPNAKSSQDGEDFIVRYKYVGKLSNDTREFCSKMMIANKVYRKEDITQLDNKVVNAGWGPEGVDTYSIWLYKGGGNCHHKWNRVIYLKKGKSVDVNSPLAQMISTSEARRRGYNIQTNDTLVSIEPRNMTNKGFLKPR